MDATNAMALRDDAVHLFVCSVRLSVYSFVACEIC